jgi:DNA-directed RNA polymerase II subunit RPB2
MEVARHVFDTYFSDVTNVLVRHHLDSYAYLLNTKIPNFISGKNPSSLDLGDGRRIDIYIGGKDGKSIKYLPPTDDFGNAILPHQCRLENKTYLLTIKVKIEIDYTIEKQTITKVFEDVTLGKIPLMVKSSLCYLSNMTSEQLYDAGECKFELGGYFIIGGQEYVLLTQERLGDNMFYASKRAQVTGNKEERTLVEKEKQIGLEKTTKQDKYEFIAAIKSTSEDGTKGPYSHFLVIPPGNVKPDDYKVVAKTTDFGDFSTNRLALITLPGFIQPIPLISVMYALGLTSDQDIYDTILAGIPESERQQYDELFMELILSHEKFLSQMMAKEEDQTEDPNMLVLYRQTRSRTKAGVYYNLYNEMFPHCELQDNESSASFYRRKAYLLGIITRMGMDVALGIKPKTDREHYRFKRLDASGDLVFQEFRRIFNEVSKNITLQLDRRIEFQGQSYEGTKIADLVQIENISLYWTAYEFINQFEKSFKGKWGGKDGISQILGRLSYLGSISHLRRVNVQMDKDTKIVEPRRIHGSSWGLMCPSDNPDGHNVGLIKSMTLLSSLSTQSPSSEVLNVLKQTSNFTQLSLIHPSTWDPRWTKIFLNSDLVGVIETDTDSLHEKLLTMRRNGQLNKYVSLCWNRLDNEYIIYTDAGRPSRPLYREGVKPEQVKRTKKWDDMNKNLLDYIDAQETECLRISMEPFSPTKLSEIHGLALLSASASVIPYCDHNPGVRTMFSCQQAKQACAWFNTAFNKRFDTVATWLNYAQRPLAQTWTANAVLGKDGCMPYGKNLIIAIATYTGYNQEDSIIFNDAALKRGLYTITYYHSYDYEEESINTGYDVNEKATIVQNKTEFANLTTDPRFRETVSRKPDYDYSMLDSNGIIKKGSLVTDKTILVGMVTPILVNGQITGYSDSSKEPKRGQHGIVDDVYIYENSIGLRCVKIRISENREPETGDKFAIRHGPKGTCGTRIPEPDMPYTSSGLIPDMIFNPHAFPSRMSTGQIIEMMMTKAGLHLGSLVDATPFSGQNRLNESISILKSNGFESHGHEILYNGMNGEMMQVEVFVGNAYYIRLKQMVEDKINYRGTGPRKLLTHQPLEGRANDGGLKIGEMERDVLLAHGISKFWNESVMERSDKSEALFQPDIGKFDANPDHPTVKLQIPYALRLYLNEIESMHISTYLETKEK